MENKKDKFNVIIKPNGNSKFTISLPVFLTIIFVILQIAGVISWPWYFIIAPIWIPLGIALIMALIVLVIVIIAILANVR